jgi:hypothetical protein
MRRLSLLVMVFAMACSEPPTVYEALNTWPTEAPVVLEVNGREVSKSEFETYWKRHPNLSAAEVTKALTLREALVGQALLERRGGAARYDFARKRGLVRSLLAKEVETVKAPVPQDVSKFERLLASPAGYRVSNLVVRPSVDGGSVDDPALLIEAQRLADILGDKPTSLDLVSAREQASPGMRVSVDLHLVFPTPDNAHLSPPPQWLNVDADFAREVDTAFGENKVIVGPFKTRFGWHVVLLEDRVEGKKPAADEVQALAGRALRTDAQKEKFFSLVKDELQNQNWTIYPDVLSKEDP